MSKLSKIISSPYTLNKLKTLHRVVKAHVGFSRIWSDKRLNESAINTIHGHRIKYYYCNPKESQLASLNKALSELGLIAKRYNVMGDYYGKRLINSLVIEKLSTEQQLIATFTL